MGLKPAISIQQQIALLQQRGMVISNLQEASEFLKENHYYRLNIYFHKLMDSPDHFRNGLSFSQVIDIYNNDSWLRNKIFLFLEQIEIQARSQIAYYLALKYGSDVFYNVNIYQDLLKYSQLKSILTSQLSKNHKDPVILHHQKKYGNRFPIWVIVEFMSFNMLSKYYSYLKVTDRKQISKVFNNSNDHLFGQWLHVLSIQRNICAHYGYLFRREFAIRPIMANSFNWNRNLNRNLFAQFLVLKHLSNPQRWLKFTNTLALRELNLQSFNLSDYGFPKNWFSYLG